MRLRGEGKVRLIGGRRLHGWTVAEDARIAPEARGAVLVCNLKENGIRCTGEIASRGYNRPVVPSHSQLFINGELQSLTRYPKGDGFLKISGVAEAEHDEWGEKSGRLEAGFYYDDDRPMRWKGKDDLWVHGYWSWDWANSYERVEELDVAERKIVNAPPYGNYGFKKGQRFCFLNILEELTEPGEYYIDQRENLLYFIPPGEKNQPGMEVMLSLLEEPVLTAGISRLRAYRWKEPGETRFWWRTVRESPSTIAIFEISETMAYSSRAERGIRSSIPRFMTAGTAA